MRRKVFTRIYVVIITVSGFFTVMLVKWQLFKTIRINTMTETPLSLLVNEKYDIGRILTQKTICFLCENEDYGKKWKRLIQHEPCQRAMFENCFRNFTKYRRSSTRVASIVRRCRLDDCECNNLESRDWCITTQCKVKLVCCEEQYLQCSTTFNYWFYTFRTSG